VRRGLSRQGPNNETTNWPDMLQGIVTAVDDPAQVLQIQHEILRKERRDLQ
jgi:hypothetical protein